MGTGLRELVPKDMSLFSQGHQVSLGKAFTGGKRDLGSIPGSVISQLYDWANHVPSLNLSFENWALKEA